MMSEIPRPPKGLDARGRAFWRDLYGKYDFSEHEERLVLEACRMVDTIDGLGKRVDVDGLMVAGSQGQLVLHPAVGEKRQQQLALARMLSILNLDSAEDAAGLARETSTKAKAAAAARWQKPRAVRSA